jgi:hypothetical protein
VKRLECWIAGLTFFPGVVLFAAGYSRSATGYIAGGVIVLLNLLGTERSVRSFVEGRGKGRAFVFALYLLKLALTAALLAVILMTETVPPLAVLLGITTLLVALLFDFLFFPRNIGDREEP